MLALDQVRLFATYNQWMNEKILAASQQLDAEQLRLDRKAFFGSILGTLNHLVVADTIWLKRFAQHAPGLASLMPMQDRATPTALNQMLFDELPALAVERRELDRMIIAWSQELTDDDLAGVLDYISSRGPFRRPLAGVVLHFFNHQTHHRGQITTLLSQAGVDVGVTDLFMLVPAL